MPLADVVAGFVGLAWKRIVPAWMVANQRREATMHMRVHVGGALELRGLLGDRQPLLGVTRAALVEVHGTRAVSLHEASKPRVREHARVVLAPGNGELRSRVPAHRTLHDHEEVGALDTLIGSVKHCLQARVSLGDGVRQRPVSSANAHLVVRQPTHDRRAGAHITKNRPRAALDRDDHAAAVR